MNQEKIGRFIAECRKNQKLTQEQLAEKLNITYKAVSKWECGKGLPDSSLMIDLCSILKINVNELLTGEKIKEDNYMTKSEENLVNLNTQIEKRRKELTIMQYTFSAIMIIIFILNIVLNCIYKDGRHDIIVAAIWQFSGVSTLMFFVATKLLTFKK